MKLLEKNHSGYISPESASLEVDFEGAMCTSTLDPAKQLEGYGTEDEFSW